MSLTNSEIDLVLHELPLRSSRIQRVIQPDFKNLYLQLYNPTESPPVDDRTPQTAWWLRICLEHPWVRFHATRHAPSTKRSHQRFEDLLRSRIDGGRIREVEHVNHDRIVRFDIERADRALQFFLRLWGTRANALLTDETGLILDAFFRKPNENLVTGARFTPPTPTGSIEERGIREYDSNIPFNAYLDQTYAEYEHERERDTLIKRIDKALERSLRRLSGRLAEIQNGRRSDPDVSNDRHYGDLILSNMHRIGSDDEWVDVDDFDAENRQIRIPLNPRLSPAENAQRYYDSARKAEERKTSLDGSADAITHRISRIEQQRASLKEMDTISLRALLRDLQQDEQTRTTRSESPGLRFESGGFTILVGRNARENDELLRRHVRGNDWWLHTRDFPGGYVFIRSKPGKSVPLEVLIDAGMLALFFSRGRRNKKKNLYYTQVKYLRRAKDGPRGLVLPTQEKNLSVELNPERLRRLGISSGIEE